MKTITNGRVLLVICAVCMLVKAPRAFGESELSAQQNRHAATLSVQQTRWDAVLLAADIDKDGKISRTELEAFLSANRGKLAEDFGDIGVDISANPAVIDDFVIRSGGKVFNASDRDDSGFIELHESDLLIAAPIEPFDRKVGSLVPKLPEGPKEEPTLLETLDQWVSIRKSFLDAKEIGRPATFTWTYYGGADDTIEDDDDRHVYEFRGAVTLEHQFWEPWRFSEYTLAVDPVTVLEADAVSNKDRGDSKIVHRLGFQTVLMQNEVTDGLSAHNVDATFDYTTDRDYSADIVGGTFQYTPNFRRIGIGEYKKLFEVAEVALHIRWRPYLQLTFGNVQDSAGDADLMKIDDYTDLVGRLALELLTFDRLHFTPEVRLGQELANGNDTHFFYSLALRYSLDEKDRVSVEVSYEQGDTSPKFVDQQAVRTSLGLRF